MCAQRVTEEEWLDSGEAMALLKIKRTKFYELEKSGELPKPMYHPGPGGKRGRKKLWRKSELLAYMERQAAASRASVSHVASQEPLNQLFARSEKSSSETSVAAQLTPKNSAPEELNKSQESSESCAAPKESTLALGKDPEKDKSCSCPCKKCLTIAQRGAQFLMHRQMGRLANALQRRKEAEGKAQAKDPVKLKRSSRKTDQRQRSLRVSVPTPVGQSTPSSMDIRWSSARPEQSPNDVLEDAGEQSDRPAMAGKAGKAAMGAKSSSHYAKVAMGIH